jgi:hypothetical protein
MLWELRSKDLSGTTVRPKSKGAHASQSSPADAPVASLQTLLRLVHSFLLAPMTSAGLTPILLGSLPPFFHSTHPTRGDVLGPWAALPDVDVCRRALDVARTALEGADEEAGRRLREAVGKAVVGRESDDAAYWAGIMATR